MHDRIASAECARLAAYINMISSRRTVILSAVVREDIYRDKLASIVVKSTWVASPGAKGAQARALVMVCFA